jgi:hypothetical protein
VVRGPSAWVGILKTYLVGEGAKTLPYLAYVLSPMGYGTGPTKDPSAYGRSETYI